MVEREAAVARREAEIPRNRRNWQSVTVIEAVAAPKRVESTWIAHDT